VTDDTFDWVPLGKDWWMENSEAVHATANQAKFACARHMGCTRTKAAELAGYAAGDDQALRTAGSRADDTKAVQDLLTMASAASVVDTDDPYTVAEARKKIGRMVKTSLDPGVVIKGTELLSKLDQVDRDRGQTPEDDGLGEWRIARDFLLQENGATAFIAVYKSAWGNLGHVANLPLFHDVYAKMKTEPMGQAMWDWSASGLSGEMQKCLEERLGNPDWQKIARKQIWGEIGKESLHG
jgi:hypothetical protein